MNRIYHTIRVITGIIFVGAAFSKFGVLPNATKSPEMFSSEGWVFISAITDGGYLFPTIGILFLVSGLTFLFNKYVALGALLMIPVTINFSLFHLFLGLPIESTFLFFRESIAFVFLALNLYMMYSQRERYAVLLKS